MTRWICRPNPGYAKQLMEYEVSLFGSQSIDLVTELQSEDEEGVVTSNSDVSEEDTNSPGEEASQQSSKDD